jgi:hypothetical protein
MSQKTVTIFGSSQTAENDPLFELAFELGKMLAEAGMAIANGGYGGTMLAAAKGASLAGGTVTGVTCSAFGRGGPNPYVSRHVSTKNLDQRLARLLELGDAFIVLPGSTGTLLELAMIWEYANKGFLPAGKPIILLGEFWRPLVQLIESLETGGAARLRFAGSCAEAAKML